MATAAEALASIPDSSFVSNNTSTTSTHYMWMIISSTFTAV